MLRIHPSVRWALLAALIVLVPGTAMAQTQLTGSTPSGSFYRIIVPDGWTPANGLVIWNHGFDLGAVDQPNETDDMGPLLDVQLAQGYAVAASSYSLNGWAVFQTVTDLEEMVAVFEQEVGVPDQVIVYGASLGGLVTIQAIEQADLGNVVGALPICGAISGSRSWDGAYDLRLLYDAICGDVPGAAIPGGVTGLPFPPDPNFDELAMAGAVNACTGILAPPELRTQEQTDRLNTLLEVAQLPESFILTDMGFATFGIADLIYDPRKMAGALPLANADVVYGDETLDATIQRVPVDQTARSRFMDNYVPTGRVGDVKIVSIHTNGDGLVLVESQSEYASAVPAGNFSLGIVVEDEPTHCGFTAAETVGAWESLRAWVAGAPQPTAAALQAACQAADSPLFPGPCRIDPEFEVPDLDERVRPRTTCTADGNTVCIGDNDRFAVEVTWEDFEGNTGEGRAAALQTGDTGSLYFFNPGNVELVVKAIDGRQGNGNFWIFFGSLTNVAFDMTVTDTDSGLTKVYSNPAGNFSSVGDTEAF